MISYDYRLLHDGSPQTKETSARALSQIMIEESIRGLAIQQGIIKACCEVVAVEENHKKTKIFAAHAIAKILVTTNPNMISQHLRVNCIGPLLLLCR